MSQDGLELVRKLVDVVARTFYKDEFVVALDYLNRHEIARTDVLAKYLHVKNKDVYRIYNELEKHKLVKLMVRTDDLAEATLYQKRGKQRYFYIDYKHFVDVVKWRMFRLQEQVRMKMDKEQQNLGYDCPGCERRFTVLDVVPLEDPVTHLFKCDYCSQVLVDHTSPELAQKSQKEFSRVMEQFKTIIDLLRKTDSITLPAPRPLSEVPVPDIDGDPGADGGSGKAGDGKELSVARNTGAASGDMVVEFAPDLTPKEAARIREAELEKKLRQNALPAWHIWSSVSGVQMVPDQKIRYEAELRHRHYVERQAMRRSRWNRRERERARAAAREAEEQLRAAAAGGRGDAKEGAEELEAKRETFYARYYASVAQRSGLAMPPDPREHYRRLLARLAKYEELEKAELERRKQEMERIEKERKEAAAAAAAAAAASGIDRNSYRHRSRYNSHGNYGRFSRSAPRFIQRPNQRLFEFISREGGSAPAGDSQQQQQQGTQQQQQGSQQQQQGSQQQQGPEAVGGPEPAAPEPAAAPDHHPAAPDHHHPAEAPDAPDPCVEGIYALSQAKRQRLGLDAPLLLERAGATPDVVLAPLVAAGAQPAEVSVAGRAKPLAQITAADERDMTTDEYRAYWAAWHPAALA
ncbi:hypothetical protein H4R18_005087 [Coemansia javaensis]|uniref:Transcription initiation factor IIE subunit alpha N-terminal domain-containing protein n=1 Tax=Coemansia javaensis TaxID=2761396 RepID=A0A9W8H9R3_9FUNG|nr:hypothetical protein H4R18_005087 [Coemansia javaensis]